jgi:hypothetical protein
MYCFTKHFMFYFSYHLFVCVMHSYIIQESKSFILYLLTYKYGTVQYILKPVWRQIFDTFYKNLSKTIFLNSSVMLSSEVNSLDFICLFSSVWLIKLICVSPCIFNAFDFIGEMQRQDRLYNNNWK